MKDGKGTPKRIIIKTCKYIAESSPVKLMCSNLAFDDASSTFANIASLFSVPASAGAEAAQCHGVSSSSSSPSA